MDKPKFDVQSALAAMADYPAMLRRLGVIRIIEVDLAGTGIDPANAGDVTVAVNGVWAPLLAGASPVTAPVAVPAHLTANRFALRPDMRLDPGPAKLILADVDTDSAAIRLVDLGRQVYNADEANCSDCGGGDANDGHAGRDANNGRASGGHAHHGGAHDGGAYDGGAYDGGASNGHVSGVIAGAGNDAAVAEDGSLFPALRPVTLPKQLSLPSLRNAGFGLAQGDRAVELRARLVAGKALNNPGGPVALTDPAQAVIGYLLDVWDDRTQRWHTVCARRGTYRLPGGLSFTLDDEGPISLGATSREGANQMSPLYLNQSVVRWTGWSLVAPRPGTPVETEAADRVPKPGEPALPGFEVSFEARPGTLPRLRFGTGYRFQLRLVDVVGRADPLVPTSTDFSRAMPGAGDDPAKYLRFEPIVTPIVVATSPMTEGESLETLVIRPEPWPDGIIGSLLAPLLSNEPSRHIAPPKASVHLCEEHGNLDKPDGTPDPAKYQMLAQRDAVSLETEGAEDPNRPGQRYVNRSQLDVNWLPDPISRGAVLNGLSSGPVRVRFDPALFQAWPSMRGFRLQVADGTHAPAFNSLTRLLTIFVPRGEMREVRLSSLLDEPDLALLGQLGWLAEGGTTPEVIASARADILGGRAWQITPYRSLTLVNAARIPLKRPVLDAIGPHPDRPRTLGSVLQQLTAIAKVHRPSTGTLTLQAKWTDPVDLPSATEPSTQSFSASPPVLDPKGKPGPELAVEYEGGEVTFAAQHALGDTKRHKVSYSLVGTTRYMEYFVQRGRVTLTGETPSQVAKSGIAEGSDTVRSLGGATAYRRDIDYAVDYPQGTVRRLAGSGIPDGIQVEVAMVALPVSRPAASPVEVDLPSTARPLAPKVAWVVPTFGWKETSSDFGLKRTRTRSGGGLRIFLERGWYSSGVGEELAVVLANGPLPAAPDPRLLALLTQLGADPATNGPRPAAFPAPADFPLATDRRTDLVPSELDGEKVSIAAHSVAWDDSRKRWACDVVLPPGIVYQPFVSLALARYQPNSLVGVEISPVASVEWAQLAPDRSATVVMDLTDLTKVRVAVSGRSSVKNSVAVIVQSASGIDPGDLDWVVSGPPEGHELTAATQPDGTTVFTGTLILPAPRILRPQRLIITESERHPGGKRLIYTDVVRL